MHLLRLGAVLALAAATASCASPGQSCSEYGLAPGTPEFQRCQQAKTARQAAATRGAVEMIRSLDAMQPPRR